MNRRKQNIRDLQRPKPNRSPYNRVLIVCEGGKTEPNYFQAIIDDLRLDTVKVDRESDSSPRSVISHAKKLYKEDLKRNGKSDSYNKVYCVFDQDEHPTYKEALSSIKDAMPGNIFCAITSVPCFEFWLLLHFDFTAKPIVRTGERSPGTNAEHELKKFLPKYNSTLAL